MAPNGKRARRNQTIDLLAAQLHTMEQSGAANTHQTFYNHCKAYLATLYSAHAAVTIRYRTIRNLKQ